MFYVYQLRISTDELPFYIGKGKETRHLEHFKDNMLVKGNKHKINKIKKAMTDGIEVVSEILYDELTEEDAHALEVELIALYGRRDIGTGCLTNMTDGGEGMSGFVPSEEQRQKQSDLLNQPEYREFFTENTKRLWQDEGYRQRCLDGINKSWTDERRKATSERGKEIMRRPGVAEYYSKTMKDFMENNPEKVEEMRRKMMATRSTPEYKARESDINREKMQRREVRAKVWLPFYLSTRCYYKTDGWRLEYKKAIQVCCLEIKMLRMRKYGEKNLSKLIFGSLDEYKLFTAVIISFRTIHGGAGEYFDPRTDEGYLEWRKTMDVDSARRIVFRDKYDQIMSMLFLELEGYSDKTKI